MWGCLSGISEPIAALLGWAVLASSFSDELYGVLFGMVSGMMVIISSTLYIAQREYRLGRRLTGGSGL